MKTSVLQCLKLIYVFGLTFICGSCSKEVEGDPYGIDQTVQVEVKGIVVNTQIGWTLLTQQYGFLDFIEPLNDSLKIDGLKVKATIYKGTTYFDDDGSRRRNRYFKDFTFASLVQIEIASNLFEGPSSPFINVVWSPDHSDDIINYPDGYGYVVQARADSFVIGQYHFPGIEGVGTFKTEVEAYKMGMYILYLMTALNDLPGTDKADLDFLKIDWYVYVPD